MCPAELPRHPHLRPGVEDLQLAGQHHLHRYRPPVSTVRLYSGLCSGYPAAQPSPACKRQLLCSDHQPAQAAPHHHHQDPRQAEQEDTLTISGDNEELMQNSME